MAELILKLRGRELRRLPIAKDAVIIGRDETCDLHIDNAGVSRDHARVELSGGRFQLVDGGSANGTFVNGKRVDRQVLAHGDTIQVGKHTIEFSELAGPSADQVVPAGGAAPRRGRNVVGTMMLSPDQAARAMEMGAKMREVPPPVSPSGNTGVVILLLVLAALFVGAVAAVSFFLFV